MIRWTRTRKTIINKVSKANQAFNFSYDGKLGHSDRHRVLIDSAASDLPDLAYVNDLFDDIEDYDAEIIINMDALKALRKIDRKALYAIKIDDFVLRVNSDYLMDHLNYVRSNKVYVNLARKHTSFLFSTKDGRIAITLPVASKSEPIQDEHGNLLHEISKPELTSFEKDAIEYAKFIGLIGRDCKPTTAQLKRIVSIYSKAVSGRKHKAYTLDNLKASMPGYAHSVFKDDFGMDVHVFTKHGMKSVVARYDYSKRGAYFNITKYNSLPKKYANTATSPIQQSPKRVLKAVTENSEPLKKASTTTSRSPISTKRVLRATNRGSKPLKRIIKVTLRNQSHPKRVLKATLRCPRLSKRVLRAASHRQQCQKRVFEDYELAFV